MTPCPAAPSGAARSLNSRCVWALTRPGRIADVAQVDDRARRGPRANRRDPARVKADRAVRDRRARARQHPAGAERAGGG